MQFYFTRPGNSGGSALLDRVLDMIDETYSEVRVAVAYLNHDKVATSVCSRINRKLPTRIIVNTCDIIRPLEASYYDYENPQSSLVVSSALLDIISHASKGRREAVRSLGFRAKRKSKPAKISDGLLYSNMHHKFIVSDEGCLFGSANLTGAALNNNYENAVYTTSSEAVSAFSQEFEQLWQIASSVEAHGKLVLKILCPVCEDSENVFYQDTMGLLCYECGHRYESK